MTSKKSHFRKLPSVSKLMHVSEVRELVARVGEEPVKQQLRMHLQQVRDALQAGNPELVERIDSQEFLDEFLGAVKSAVDQSVQRSLITVINLTGTVLHTNLGRARLPEEAVKAMAEIAAAPCNLEFNLDSGKRGHRDSHVEALICELTGAEAATVVNNNAAAVVLVLNTLSMEREVLISRGEMVEIGGSFRMPDVMRSANSVLREVGTTNRTHLQDYARAIGERTGLIMKVHTSNYQIQGFTNTVDEAELSNLAKEHCIPFVSDLGSGSLIDMRQLGLPYEPTVASVLAAGTDLVTFSGDKLLGGPQAGIIAGRRHFIDRIRHNPLKRALRVDKLTTAALLGVLDLYRDTARLRLRLPLLIDLTRPLSAIQASAELVLPAVRNQLEEIAEVRVIDCQSQVGSGSLPVELLPSKALQIMPLARKGQHDAALARLASAFRALPKPVIGRVHDGRLLFDLRCLGDESDFLHQLELLDVQAARELAR